MLADNNHTNKEYTDKNTKHRDYILAIDNGTQSVRALIFDRDGQLLAKHKIDLEAYFSCAPGWAEQHPKYYWQSLGEACRGLWAKSPIRPEQIKALALTTQRGTLVNLDAAGEPLRPAMVWLDQRRVDRLDSMGPLWNGLFGLIGAKGAVAHFRSQAEANWLAQQQPDIWARTDKFLLLSAYLTYRLTGEFVDSVGSTLGYLPFDYKRQSWAKASDWRWRALPIKPSMLPELKPPGETLGYLTRSAAEHLGLAACLPLIASASDKACEVIGAGALDNRVGCMSYGTTATINSLTHKYTEVAPFVPPYPAAIPNTYCTEVMIYRGFWMVNWFKREFALREEQIAAQRGVAAEQLFDELVNQVPPGSMGLMLQPYWSPGVRQPGPEAKGAIIGFGDVHTRAHIYRAILEGLAYALREGKERTEKRTGVRMQQLKVSGGGSQSDAAMQLTADIFAMPVERPHVYETSGLGAAMAAAVGLGWYGDFASAIAAMSHPGDRFEPDPTHSETYERLYTEVYKNMYPQLKSLYRSIQDITGYPK